MNYKFTIVYIVSAPTKSEAEELLRRNPDEYLEFKSVRQVLEGNTGWGKAFKRQITGKE